jgi:hypothetical protein
MKCIQFSVEGKSATAYSPIWRTDKEWDMGPCHTDSGCIVNRERKRAAVLINTLLCCGVHVGCVTSSVRISKDDTDMIRSFRMREEVCKCMNLVCHCEKDGNVAWAFGERANNRRS